MKISDGMIQKLDKIEARCNEVGQLLSMPENISDQEKFKALSKEHSDLMPICEIYSVYKSTRAISKIARVWRRRKPIPI